MAEWKTVDGQEVLSANPRERFSVPTVVVQHPTMPELIFDVGYDYASYLITEEGFTELDPKYADLELGHQPSRNSARKFGQEG